MKINCCPSKVVRAFAEKHPERISEIDYGSGYSTESGNAYDILLAPGWCADDIGCHTIIEETAKETMLYLRGAERCECKECREIAMQKAQEACQ